MEKNTTIENGSGGEIVSLTYDSRPTTAISLDKPTLNLVVNGEATLKATLTPVYSTDAITWSSSNNGVVTVDQSGNLSAVSIGEATITATAGGFSAECNVSVFRTIINLADKSYSVAKPANGTDLSTTTIVGGYTLDLFNAHNNNAGYTYMMLSKDGATKASLISNKTSVPGAITKIRFVTTSGASGSAVYEAVLSSTEVASPVTNNNNKLTGKGSLTITANALDNLRYFAISGTSETANGQIESIYINYESTQETINATPTRTTLSYGYTNSGSFVYSNVGIRFGGSISVALWNRLNAESAIQSYGVMLAVSNLGGQTIKQRYETELEGHTVDQALATLTDENNPIVKNFVTDVVTLPSDEVIDGYYVWSLYKNIAPENLQIEYTAVAYIRTASGIIFFNQQTYSAKTLAADYIANRGYDNDAADGSLYNLAHLGE